MKYKCLACGQKFTAPRKVTYVRHNKFGGCQWGIGKRLKVYPARYSCTGFEPGTRKPINQKWIDKEQE